jgi:hypothetical protein
MLVFAYNNLILDSSKLILIFAIGQYFLIEFLKKKLKNEFLRVLN